MMGITIIFILVVVGVVGVVVVVVTADKYQFKCFLRSVTLSLSSFSSILFANC
jgi:hypothetical protein